jgi:hypothetical protein
MTATEASGNGVLAFTATHLESARRVLCEARAEPDPEVRYGCAYLAALRAASALAASQARGGRPPGCGGPGNLWERLAATGPPLSAWAVSFAARGRARPAGPTQADTLIRDAESFIALVEQRLAAG